jgi:hypothetical protein
MAESKASVPLIHRQLVFVVMVKKPFMRSIRKTHVFNDHYTLEERCCALYRSLHNNIEIGYLHELYVWHVWFICVTGVSHSR